MENLNSEVPDSILEKIQKLIALRDRPGSPAEAQNAAARISSLLTKYNISMMDVDNHKPDDGVEVKKGSYDDFQTPYEGDFAKNLLNSLAFFNFCQLITIPSSDPMSKGSYTIFGKKHNLEITEYMFQYCLNNIKMFFNDYWETVEFKEKKNMKKRAFYQGAVTALTVRLRRQKKESEQEHGIAKMNSLVKYNDAAVDKKVSEFFPKLTKGRTIKQCTDTDAINKGYKAGQVLNLSKGISETGEETKRLN